MNSLTVSLATELMPAILMVIGMLAFMVTVITEVVKNLGFIKKIPTDIVVIFLSFVITLTAMVAYAAYANIEMAWYFIIAALAASFFVAFVAMYGWTKLNDLCARFKPNK